MTICSDLPYWLLLSAWCLTYLQSYVCSLAVHSWKTLLVPYLSAHLFPLTCSTVGRMCISMCHRRQVERWEAGQSCSKGALHTLALAAQSTSNLYFSIQKKLFTRIEHQSCKLLSNKVLYINNYCAAHLMIPGRFFLA